MSLLLKQPQQNPTHSCGSNFQVFTRKVILSPELMKHNRPPWQLGGFLGMCHKVLLLTDCPRLRLDTNTQLLCILLYIVKGNQAIFSGGSDVGGRIILCGRQTL